MGGNDKKMKSEKANISLKAYIEETHDVLRKIEDWWRDAWFNCIIEKSW